MAVSTRSLLKNVPIIVVLGATGTGKSKLALNIASRFSAEIVSADSMQVYKGLDIITNKVTAEEQTECVHHMINYIDPLHQTHKVTDFRNKALPIIDNLLSQQKLPIIVGGTNYYIEALLWNFLVDEKEKKEANKNKKSLRSRKRRLSKDLVSEDAESPRVPVTNGTESDSSNSDDQDDVECDGNNKGRWRSEYESLDNNALHQELLKVDPLTAMRLHPADRRKVLRALEVYHQQGKPLSEILSKQHEAMGDSALSGPLRFDSACIFWVQCDQKVLDERLDARVDDMIKRGLIQELTEFHKSYNSPRIKENKEADYTLGIFQSIGFKEFHEYLLLPEDERQTEHGKKLFQQGVEQLKLVTRQYARRQNKWIRNRFLRRPGGNVPPVYGVDSTHPENWDTDVLTPAIDILSAIIEGETPSIQPLPCEEQNDQPEYNICDICGGKVFVSKLSWEAHLRGKKHKGLLKRKRLLEKKEAEILEKSREQDKTETEES